MLYSLISCCLPASVSLVTNSRNPDKTLEPLNPGDDKIRFLNRILSSPGFKGSRVLSGFLEFVTRETLAGRQQEIKEYSIGVHVLFKKMDFNPQLDSIVRIHAGRLRRALNEYYQILGNQDPIRIDIPKGCYIPVLDSQNVVPKTEIPKKILSGKTKPVVAILPFRNISRDGSRDFFADGLGEQL